MQTKTAQTMHLDSAAATERAWGDAPTYGPLAAAAHALVEEES